MQVITMPRWNAASREFSGTAVLPSATAAARHAETGWTAAGAGLNIFNHLALALLAATR